MSKSPDDPLDRLWKEYTLPLRDFDDLSLARWMSQTLTQMQGRAWRLSHPLVGAYRLAAGLGHERQVWLKRLVSMPGSYTESPCCRAPLLPLLTRDVPTTGLICEHCSGTAVPFEDLPPELQRPFKAWADEYHPIHEVAHWDENQKSDCYDYEDAVETAASEAERLLVVCGRQHALRLLEFYPAAIWEDQDECLEVRAEDIVL